MTTLAEAVAEARRVLTAAGLADAAVEARILIAGLLGISSTELFTGGDRLLKAEEIAAINAAVQRRLRREPVHRILGQRGFHGLDLLLSKDTLEPRPDTEVLVDAVVEAARTLEMVSPRILDLGTGSGAIILAVLNDLPDASGLGIDKAGDAVKTARDNAERLGFAPRFRALESHWFDKIEGRFDIIVSNPPYIRSDVIPELEPEVRDFDPVAALDGGPDGLSAYREIAGGAGRFLKDGGFLAVEIGFDQKIAVTSIFEAAGFTLAQARRDYGGNDRVLLFERALVDAAKQKKRLGIPKEPG